MSAKSVRNRHNQEAESHLLDHDKIEQRALQIARDEGRDLISADDRARAREELLAPNETEGEPETAPDIDPKMTVWDEAPESSGRQVPRVLPEDEASVGKELAEKGMPGPRETRTPRNSRAEVL